MSALGRLFAEKFHRSDASASWRWAAALCAVLGFTLVGGSILSVIAIGCGLVAWAYFFWDRRRFAFNRNDRLITFWFVAYVAVTALVAIAHANPAAGLKSVLKLLPFLVLAPLAPVLRDSWRPYWDRWIRVALISGAALSAPLAELEVYSLPPLAARAELYTGNPLILGYLAGALCLANMVLGLATEGRWQYLHFLASILAFWTTSLSGSRAPFLLIIGIGAAILLTGLLRHRGFKSFKVYGLALGAALVLTVAVQAGAFSQTLVRLQTLWEAGERASYESIDQSFSERIAMAQAGWSAFQKRPLLGYGRQNVSDAANAQFNDDPVLAYTHLHNALLTEAIASGLVGVALLLGVLATPVIAARGASRPHRDLALAFAVYTALYSMTNIGFYHDITASYFCLVVAVLGCLPRRADKGVGDEEFKDVGRVGAAASDVQ